MSEWVRAALGVRRSHELTDSDMFVLVTLAAHANATGLAFPGTERLAELAGRDRRTVQRSLRRLEQSGLIAREAGGVGRGRRQRFRLLLTAAVSGRLKAQEKAAPDPGKGGVIRFLKGGAITPPEVEGRKEEEGLCVAQWLNEHPERAAELEREAKSVASKKAVPEYSQATFVRAHVALAAKRAMAELAAGGDDGE